MACDTGIISQIRYKYYTFVKHKKDMLEGIKVFGERTLKQKRDCCIRNNPQLIKLFV